MGQEIPSLEPQRGYLQLYNWQPTLAGSDYSAKTGALRFTPGQLSKTVTVNVKGNTVAEPNATFFVNLSSAVGAKILDSQGVWTIRNDDR